MLAYAFHDSAPYACVCVHNNCGLLSEYCVNCWRWLLRKWDATKPLPCDNSEINSSASLRWENIFFGEAFPVSTAIVSISISNINRIYFIRTTHITFRKLCIQTTEHSQRLAFDTTPPFAFNITEFGSLWIYFLLLLLRLLPLLLLL